uniref:Homing endonuclease LAGLIDADG domain-containing protein n=1 Tax=Morchella brunnea TaxID=1174671 RepID=A0A8K1I7P3_9PEZI|nr:hypothetical protein LK370_mgp038 [Morchella brunnea]UBU98592.1 hypothetical protein [Morchella brunnea]
MTLSHYCPSYPKFGTGTRAGTRVYDLLFYTRSLPCITELYNLFYVNGIKIIPHNIYELLTPVALAHWVMGDGSKKKYGLTLCSNSYSIPDVVLLMNVLMIKYGLVCTLHLDKGKPTIYIAAKSMKSLRTIVAPHMVPSMQYKIGLGCDVTKLNSSPLGGIIYPAAASSLHEETNDPPCGGKFQRQGINQ